MMPELSSLAQGAAEMVRDMLKLGVHVNACDADANTALHFAAEEGHADVCKELVSTSDHSLITMRWLYDCGVIAV